MGSIARARGGREDARKTLNVQRGREHDRARRGCVRGAVRERTILTIKLWGVQGV